MEDHELYLISVLLFEILEQTNSYPGIWNIIREIIARFEEKNNIKFQSF